MFWITFVFTLNILCLILFNDIAQIQTCEASDREAKEHATPFNKGWKGETFHMPGASVLIFLLAQNLFCTIFPFCQEVKCTMQTSFGKRSQQLLPSTPLSKGLHDATPSFVKRFLFWDAPLLSRGCFMGIIPTRGHPQHLRWDHWTIHVSPSWCGLHRSACHSPGTLAEFLSCHQKWHWCLCCGKAAACPAPTMLPGEVDGGWRKLEFLQLCPGLLLPVCAIAIHQMHIIPLVMELPKRTFSFPAGPPCWLLLLVELEPVPVPSPLVPQGYQLSFLFPFVVASQKAPPQELVFFPLFKWFFLRFLFHFPILVFSFFCFFLFLFSFVSFFFSLLHYLVCCCCFCFLPLLARGLSLAQQLVQLQLLVLLVQPSAAAEACAAWAAAASASLLRAFFFILFVISF